MMICTYVYLSDAIWRDGVFSNDGSKPDDDPYNDLDDVDTKITCSNKECHGYRKLYMYSRGGSGFLGATYKNIEVEGVYAYDPNNENQSTFVVDIELKDTIHLSESRENIITFSCEYSCDLGDEACQDLEINFDKMEFKSIDAAFWDFMPIGPGNLFGVAKSNEFHKCPDKATVDGEDYYCVKSDPQATTQPGSGEGEE